MANESQRIGKGYCGRVLHVDLSTSAISTQELDEAFYQKYLGGLGLGAKILWDRIKPGVDPVGPDNVLGFTAGLLTDTGSLLRAGSTWWGNPLSQEAGVMPIVAGISPPP